MNQRTHEQMAHTGDFGAIYTAISMCIHDNMLSQGSRSPKLPDP
jgi:hypothetical protein